MAIQTVPGQDRGDIFLYALSTCVWCKKIKALLNELGVAYRYLDVDLVGPDEREAVMREVARWNPQRNFPTLVVDGRTVIVGFKPERIREVLER
ncbi:MAG: glutaredoxin family protein [Chloroflexia bacterium]